MSYYSALIAQWPSVKGDNTDEKLAVLNALMVPSAPVPPNLDAATLNAAIDFDELASLTSGQLNLLTYLMGIEPVDVVKVRKVFAGKIKTLAAISTLTAPFDNPVAPWWQANGYPREFDPGDIEAAGLK